MALMHKLISLFAILVATPLIGVSNAQTFYDGVIGPLTITKDGRATLLVPVDNREMSLRIVYPDQGGPYPIIVFSHGTFSSGDKYDLVVDFWAERGYVVILPNHLDANYGIIPNLSLIHI